jgi:hypothetical protein
VTTSTGCTRILVGLTWTCVNCTQTTSSSTNTDCVVSGSCTGS